MATVHNSFGGQTRRGEGDGRKMEAGGKQRMGNGEWGRRVVGKSGQGQGQGLRGWMVDERALPKRPDDLTT